MRPCCWRLWTIIHVLWSIIYITCGASQLVAGIFFLISIPEVQLSSNICSGCLNIILGIGAGMVACFGQLTSRRQETLLYIAVSILAVNAVNIVLSEWYFYWADMSHIMETHSYHKLIVYACFATRLAAAVLIGTSFVDSQLSFCTMQVAGKPTTKKLQRSHEQVSDIEYIIPRTKSSVSKQYSAYNAYAQSWVFDAETGSCSNHNSSPYLKLSQNGTPKPPKSPIIEPEILVPKDTAHLIDNPVVHIEEASDHDDSTSNSDRKLNYMRSFSRAASPVILSASSSQLSLNMNQSANQAPIYECLERLTEQSVYRSRLNSALSSKDEECTQNHSSQPAVFKRVEALTPQGEKVQYASLMKELTRAIGSKKEANSVSPQSASGSTTTPEKMQTDSKGSSRTDGKNSDAEFSKELEAALQLIQDLESPNTIDTPSEPKLSSDGREARPLAIWRNSDASLSEKTLSAVGSLVELSPMTECHPELCTFKTTANGKGACVLVRNSESQSTSGYSSPTRKSNFHTPTWSAASSINGSNNDLGTALSYCIHNTKNTAVISLYTPQDTLRSKPKSISLVTITGNNEPISTISDTHRIGNDHLKRPTRNENRHFYIKNDKTDDESRTIKRSSSIAGAWNVKSILRKKKQRPPKLCPELEGAIVKSESLAYLSELELLARHQRNKEIERQIEQRVLQQLGVPKTESNC